MPDQNNKQIKGHEAKAARKRKWEAKQQQKELIHQNKRQQEDWCAKNSPYVTYVTDELIQQVMSHEDIPEFVTLLKPYFSLREVSQQRQYDTNADVSSSFIAEGTETIRLLIQQSHKSEHDTLRINVKSIFVKPSILFDEPVHLLHDLEQIAAKADSTVSDGSNSNFRLPFHVFVAEEQIMSQVAGFQIARGALACGDVPQNRSEEWLLKYLHDLRDNDHARPLRLLALDSISDTANLGSMIRTSSAFGIAAVVLSKDSCDAWYRRAVRVSMGHVFRVPCVRVDDLAVFLERVKQSSLNICSYAAVIDPASDLVLENMGKGSVGNAWCCIMGNESKGISQKVRNASSLSVRIGMEADVDSLSVPVATGILLHGLKERERNN